MPHADIAHPRALLNFALLAPRHPYRLGPESRPRQPDDSFQAAFELELDPSDTTTLTLGVDGDTGGRGGRNLGGGVVLDLGRGGGRVAARSHAGEADGTSGEHGGVIECYYSVCYSCTITVNVIGDPDHRTYGERAPAEWWMNRYHPGGHPSQR
jgi:hypothetical protein